MKFLVFLSLISISANAETFVCVLANKALNKSPVATVRTKKKGQPELTITKSLTDSTKIATISVRDEGEDVIAVYTADMPALTMRFYLDESDDLGLTDGTINTHLMKGDIKCNRRDY